MSSFLGSSKIDKFWGYSTMDKFSGAFNYVQDLGGLRLSTKIHSSQYIKLIYAKLSFLTLSQIKLPK